MFFLVAISVVILYLTGIFFLVFGRRLLLFIAKLISSAPMTSSPVTRVTLWKLRILGTTHILIALFFSIALAMPQAVHYIPSFIPIFVYSILSLVTLVFYFKSKKPISKEPDVQRQYSRPALSISSKVLSFC